MQGILVNGYCRDTVTLFQLMVSTKRGVYTNESQLLFHLTMKGSQLLPHVTIVCTSSVLSRLGQINEQR